MKLTYKTVDLFGKETLHFYNKKIESKKTLFTDYEAFEAKKDEIEWKLSKRELTIINNLPKKQQINE